MSRMDPGGVALLVPAIKVSNLTVPASEKGYRGPGGSAVCGLPAGGEETFLIDGSQIPVTQSAIVLEEVIAQFVFSQSPGTSIVSFGRQSIIQEIDP